MADLADLAQDVIDQELQECIAAARKPLPPGEPGDCNMCGEESPRLVGGACARCRERYKLA